MKSNVAMWFLPLLCTVWWYLKETILRKNVAIALPPSQMFFSKLILGQRSTDVGVYDYWGSVSMCSLFITNPCLPPLLPQCEWAGKIALLRTQLWNWNWNPGSNYWIEQTGISCQSSSSPTLGSHQLCRTRYAEWATWKSIHLRTETFRGATWKSIHFSQF